MKRYNIRPATSDDYMSIYGELPLYLTKAWSVDYDGRLAGIAGVMFQKSTILIFSDIVDNVSVPKITIYKVAQELMEKISGVTKYGIAVSGGNSCKFLKRLGFELFAYDRGREYYRWQTR